jgi:hypothetical protein
MSFTHRLNSTGETIPPWATTARMSRHMHVDDWKDVWNLTLRPNILRFYTRQRWYFRLSNHFQNDSRFF